MSLWNTITSNIQSAQAGGLTGSALQASVQDKNDATFGTDLRGAYNTALFPWSGLMTYDNRGYASGWSSPYTSKYGTPKGEGPGGALAGAGQGRETGNSFERIGNVPGAGLWSAGIDPNNAANVSKLYSDIMMANKQLLPQFEKFYKPGTKMGVNELNEFLDAADWYYRDEARKSDLNNSFFDSGIGKIIGGIATAGAGAAFGPLGGLLFGAGIGASSENRGMGALMGGLGGFGSGLVANAGGVGNLLKNPSSAFQGSGWYLPGGGGLVGAPTVAGAAQSAGSSAGQTVATSAGGGLLGGSAPIVNGASSVGGLSPLVTSPTGVGGSMGFFDSLGSFLSNNAGSLIGAGVNAATNLYGASQAQQTLNNAAQQAATAGKFTPYNITTPGGGGFFNGTNATGALSPEIAAQLANQTQAANQAYGAYQKFNPQNYAQNMYNTIKSYKAPTDQFDASTFLDKLYSKGQWGSTPGEGALFDYGRQKTSEDNMFRLQSQQAGGVEQDRLFNNYLLAAKAQMSTANSPLDYITAGSNIGQGASQTNLAAANFPWNAAQSSAAASANFWSYLGGSASNLINSFAGQQPARSAAPAANYSGPLSPGYQYG